MSKLSTLQHLLPFVILSVIRSSPLPAVDAASRAATYESASVNLSLLLGGEDVSQNVLETFHDLLAREWESTFV